MKLRGRVLPLMAASAIAIGGLAACGGGEDPTDNSESTLDLEAELTASGASFPDAYYQVVIEKFADVAPGVVVNYEATGSGTGKEQFSQNLTDFAGTDSLVGDDDGVKADSFFYVPTVAAPITVSYNLPDVEALQLSADTIAGIFQAEITTWDDPAIAEDNPDAELPSTAITVAHRSDGSGTTTNFTTYLDDASEDWKLGAGDTVEWPASTQGGEKNTGVAQIIQQTEGAIGYVDLADAKASDLAFASVKNSAGNYIEPSIEGTTAALEGAEINDDLSYNPLNADGDEAYPISAPTYLLVRASYDDANTAKAVTAFIEYLLTDGQDLAAEVDFAPLPESLREKALAQLDKVKS
ncbi:phosphate ABC transporter substrate-binding protein PstS [Stackebrandtia soli]|uniref:phosphate ABC transporter substrate-binding protein PstS n=1 Tax=Stackebrandtia soli TaxID=1892856 RepID=UPI0039EC5DE3